MPHLETLAVAALLIIGLWRLSSAWWARLLTSALAIGAAALVWRVEPPGPVAPGLPGPSPDEALTTSATCRACHPAAYASWRATYHSTMTQVATPQSVLGDFDGVELSDRGIRVRLERREDDTFWAHLLTPEGAVDRSRQIIMTTGSHHMQNYWMLEDGGWYIQLPFLWRIDAGRWLPAQDSFLHPDKPRPQAPGVWNGHCGYCHSVGNAARLERDTADTRAAELGIACEACHGPGAAHLDTHRDPLRRYASGGDDDTMTVPSDLPPDRENAVCGQCHGVFLRTDLAATHARADRFRPGDPLEETRQLFLPRPNPTGFGELLIPPPGAPPPTTARLGGISREVELLGLGQSGIYLRADPPLPGGPGELVVRSREAEAHPDLRLGGFFEPAPGGLLRLLPNRSWPQDIGPRATRLMGWRGEAPEWFDLSAFWPDGTVRSTGREANALAVTGCATHGEMACSSCHSMHDPIASDDLLARGMDGDEACLQCHREEIPDVAAHSHHPAESAGARCYNCHMPHTTFGLLGAIRSHRVDSPDAHLSWRTGRPNACNLCHTDRTLGWAGRWLTEWYERPPLPRLPPPWDATSAAAVWALMGDGAQRGVAAWALGWSEAQAASGVGWTAAPLAALLEDDYAAVRSIAGRTLRRLPGFEGWSYDFVGAPEARRAAAEEARRRAAALKVERTGPATLRGASGGVDQAAINRLRAHRDRAPVYIAE